MSQLAFHQLIAKGIGRNFVTTVEATEEYLRFFISADLFCADAILTGFEPEPNHQAVKVTLWPCDSEGSYLNFANIPYDNLLFLCHKLSRSVEWGSITPMQVDPDGAYLNIYACFDTDIEDIETMNRLDADGSRLLRSLLRLCREVQMLYPALYGVATGQIKDITHIEKFLSEEEEETIN
jgi:hypothetical protein